MAGFTIGKVAEAAGVTIIENSVMIVMAFVMLAPLFHR